MQAKNPDIRSYFSAKPKQNGHLVSKPPEKEKKRKIPISSDDDDDEKEKDKQKTTPAKPKAKPKKRRIVDESDEEIPHKKKSASDQKKPNLSMLKDTKPKEVDLASIYGKSPVQRVEREKKVKPIPKLEIPSDDEFERSIANLDEPKEPTPKKRDNKTPQKNKKTPTKTPVKKELTPKREIVKTPKLEKEKEKPASTLNNSVSNGTEEKASKSTPTKSKPPAKPSLESKSKPKSAKKTVSTKNVKKQEESDLETSVMMDEERHEKKQLLGIMYQKFKNRSTVLNPGSKEIPEGKPNCLAGKTFLVTGILEAMERVEAEELIKKYGGKVLSGVTKKLMFMVVGEEAGPAKLAKADDLNVKQLSEDGLLDMIRESNDSGKKEPKSTPIKQKKEFKIEKNKSSEKKKKKERKSEEFTEFVVKKKLKLEPESHEVAGSSKEPEVELKNVENLAWVDKYKPTSTKQIIGQQGAASNCVKLIKWLENWHTNQFGAVKPPKPSPWSKNDSGAYFKAALLSGPPGVGKTTTASLVCKELGFDTVEFNASDTRSKKQLKEQVSELLSNKSLFGYFHGDKSVSSRHVLLMDEVDGMAGNEDRGGIQELITLIKESSIPIICMCNDRNAQKIRSLVNHCFDLRFPKPRLEQIRGAMMSVCFREKIKLDAKTIGEIITATNNDVRQTLNYLAMMSAGKELPKSEDGEKRMQDQARKDLRIGPFEVVRKIFSVEENQKMSMNEKSDLFFQDYSMGPLFVHENYLQVAPEGPKSQVLPKVAKTASSLSRGDLIERRIRSNNNWSVLPVQAMFSSVIPGEFMKGRVTGMINFPGWLGKNSKRTKRSRIAQEIHDHTRVATSGSRMSIRMDYAPYLLTAVVKPLQDEGMEGVPKALEVMKEYRLTKDDIDSLIELSSWPGNKNPMDSVESKVKAALTRAYNKELVGYTHSAGKKKKVKEVDDDDEDFLDNGDSNSGVASEEEEEDDKLDNDALIKAKKPAAAPKVKKESSTKVKKESTNKATTSKKK